MEKEYYLEFKGNFIVKTPKLTGFAKKLRDKHIENRSKGIVSFDLSPLKQNFYGESTRESSIIVGYIKK